MSIDERILALEKIHSPTCSGTTISRQLKPDIGMQWCIGLGRMYLPKYFYTGDTIEEALTKAENDHETLSALKI
jgi:hypothetical protein